MRRNALPKSFGAIYQAQLVLGTVFNFDFVLIFAHSFKSRWKMRRNTVPKSSGAIYQAQLVLGTVFNLDFVRIFWKFQVQ